MVMAEDKEWMEMTIIEGFERWFAQILDAGEKAAEATMITGDGAPKPGAAENSVKARFRELLWKHPELTRPQAYMQAVMEIVEPAIETEVKAQ